MSVRVRFAPSPTGLMHLGNARTALYNYFFAQANQGTFILRVEDTDEERSLKEYEQKQLADLRWMGLSWQEGPDVGGNYGPYRQSERKHIYEEHAHRLMEEGKAYYCFCSEEELERKKEEAMKMGKPPHYDGKCRHVSFAEASAKVAAGEKAVVRFKAPHKSYVLEDIVRDRVVFPEGMVGDFVLLRSGNMPVYNFCCVVDDMLMKITHVIRGEDHLSNTVRQLMIYEAFGYKDLPKFAHLSLIIGKDKQKLSKRHGATSVENYREAHFLPSAFVNYLCLLGWSHPGEKDIFDGAELSRVFTLDRFSSSPATFDPEKFTWVNGQHLKLLDKNILVKEVSACVPPEHVFHQQSKEWQEKCVEVYKDHLHFFHELTPHLEDIFGTNVNKEGELKEIFSWETTPAIVAYLKKEISELSEDFITEEKFNQWSEHIKGQLKIKGKPLFMGMRGVLTAKAHGPELKFLIPLTPVSILKERMKNL